MKNVLKGIIYSGLALVPFVPMVVLSDFFFPFITGKAFVFRILVEVIFAAWLLLAAVDVSYRPKRSAILYAFSLFMAVILLADIFGFNFGRSFWSNYERMEGYIALLHLFAYFLVMGTVLNSQKLWHRMLNWSIVSSVILTLFYALPQLTGSAAIHQSSTRLDASLGNSAYFAVYLMFHIFLALYFLFRSEKLGLRITYGVVAILQFIFLYQTETRGVMLGLIGGLGLAMLLVAIFERERKTIRKIAIGSLLAIVALIGIFISVRNTDWVHNNPTLKRFAEMSFSRSFLEGQGRFYVWPMAVKGIQDRPILGYGQNNFSYVFNEHYDPRMYGQEQWFDRSHNIVLDWAIAGGVLGLLAYLGLLGALVWMIWRSDRQTFSVIEKGLLTGLVAGYFFQNLFVFDNISSYILYMTILAFVYAMRVNTNAKPIFSKPILTSELHEQIAAAGMLIVLGVGMFYVNIAPMRANAALLRAVVSEGGKPDYKADLEDFKLALYRSGGRLGESETLEHLAMFAQRIASDSTVDAALKSEAAEVSALTLQSYVDSQKHKDARYHLFLGSVYARYGKSDDAIRELTIASELSPRKQLILVELANAYFTKNDAEKSYEIIKSAFELEPRFSAVRSSAIILALRQNKLDVFEELFASFPEPDVFQDDRLLQALIDAKKMDKVIWILEKRVELEPTNEQYVLTLASIQHAQKNIPAAVSALEKFISVNPEKNSTLGNCFIDAVKTNKNPQSCMSNATSTQ